jgi:hypothetical protein
MNLLEFSTIQLIRFVDRCIEQQIKECREPELQEEKFSVLQGLINLKCSLEQLSKEELFIVSRLISYVAEYYYEVNCCRDPNLLEETTKKQLQERLQKLNLSEDKIDFRVKLTRQFVVLFSKISERFAQEQCPNPFLNPPIQTTLQFVSRLTQQTWIPLTLLAKLQTILTGFQPLMPKEALMQRLREVTLEKEKQEDQVKH